MTQYEHSLIAMKRLLDAVGESYWANWIDTDLTAWQAHQSVSHHMSAYGGMGSFNDIWICRANQHAVTEHQEPWANTLFEWLKSTCHFLAQHPNDTFEAKSLAVAIGRHDSTLAAFIGGDKAPASMRGYAHGDRKLRGWRCLRCGHAESSHRDIETLIAQDIVPKLVFESCERLSLDKLVDQVLEMDIHNITTLRQTIATALVASGISLLDRDGWMRTCPKCKTDDTAAYRWRLIMGRELRFEPADDNLSMRK